MSEINTFNNTANSLFDGMSKFMSTKTVVGEPIQVGDITILPLCDVSFGLGAGASGEGAKNSSCGGMGGKMSPSAVLVINNGISRIVNIKNQDTVTKLVDMLPDIINRFTAMLKKENKEEPSDEEIVEVAKESVENN